MGKPRPWEPAVWYGTSDPEITKEFDCYRRPVRRGYVWLLVYKDEYLETTGGLGCKYHFTSEQGPDSQDSYSGLLPAENNYLTLAEAQQKAYDTVKQRNEW
jgi:hypothetical protein